ncbi:MAG: ATP-binding protein [Firmicutes bacterium]|nr:ATP-binding protein [Bacillota bacterium]
MVVKNSENILKVLFAYNGWWISGEVPKELLRKYKRRVFHEANNALNHKDVRRHVILCGARRTGKSTAMYQTVDLLLAGGTEPRSILLFSFDHPLLKMCSIEEILEVYKQSVFSGEMPTIFIDEIQYGENWESYLKIIYDISPKTKVMATGSASSAISKKIKESGHGRWTAIAVPSLSFCEYLEITETPTPVLPVSNIDPLAFHELPVADQTAIITGLSELQAPFLQYVQKGGFPEISLSSDAIYSGKILREDIVDRALKKDIPSVYDIRSTNDLERIFLYLCYNSGNLVNIEAISKELNGVSRITVEKYISYLESANLINICKPVNLAGKSALKQQDKIYVADSSIRANVLMLGDVLTDPEELGVLVEGICYAHIKNHFSASGSSVGYFRTSGKGKEIDIVVHKNHRPEFLAEIKYRESAPIKEDDAIVANCAFGKVNYVITKRNQDYGVNYYKNGAQIYRIPVHVFLYLLGK